MTATTAASGSTNPVLQLVQIPTSRGVVLHPPVRTVQDAQAWALDNVDTSTRWIVRRNGRNVAEAIVVTRYRYDCHEMRVAKKVCNFIRPGRYFDTPEQAQADYDQHRAEADRRLDVIVARFAALQAELDCDISYIMEGDTYGIHTDHLYASVKIGGYEYRREIEE